MNVVELKTMTSPAKKDTKAIEISIDKDIYTVSIRNKLKFIGDKQEVKCMIAALASQLDDINEFLGE